MNRVFKIVLIWITLSILAATHSFAQNIKTPTRGSAERTAILDAMRPNVEAAMRGPVVFVISTMNVADGWAFVTAQPQRPDGSAIDPYQTGYAQDIEFMDGLSTIALLRYDNARWNLIDLHTGPTDVSYSIWPELFGVPAPIIGFPSQ